jgi:2-polyprenyl-3-methyl-5-hydroxy-6-metoxy-1,4-benzoquinol methylase
MKCPICFSEKVRFKLTGRDVYEKLVPGDYSLYQCKYCKCIFQFPMPNQEEIGTFYANDYYSYQVDRKKSFFDNLRENTIRVNYVGLGQFPFFWKIILFFTGRQFKDILPTNKHGGNFLDVGCGDATNLRILKDYGWNTYGIEINENAVRMAKEQGLQVSCSMLDQYDSNVKFHAIRLWHVLEHLPDPHKAMEKLNSLLVDKGIVYIAIPNTKSLNAFIFRKYWIGYDIPRHLIDYSPKAFRLLLKKHGFQMLSFKYASTSGLLCSISNMINGLTKKKLRLGNNSLFVLLTYPYDLLTDLLGLGDIVYIKIQKNDSK